MSRSSARPIQLRFRKGEYEKKPPPFVVAASLQNVQYDLLKGTSQLPSLPAAQNQPAPKSPDPSSKQHLDDDHRSTVCAICKVDTGNFNLNYGANTCLSCRAFFRRAIQKTRTPNFVCKLKGRCEINEETRRTCKKCRFDRCVLAGMNADCVMRGEQVQERFAKYIQRKKGVDKKATTMARLTEVRKAGIQKERRRRRMKASVDQVGTVSTMTENLLTVDTLIKQEPLIFDLPDLLIEQPESQQTEDQFRGDDVMFRSSPPSDVADDALFDDEDITALFDLDLLSGESVTLPPQASSPVTSDSGNESLGGLPGECVLSDVLFEDVPDPQQTAISQHETMVEKVKFIRESWSQACEDHKFDIRTVTNILSALTNKQLEMQPHQPHRLQPSLLETIKNVYERVFSTFAAKQSTFAKLAVRDQQTLLSKNSSLFVHYIFARIITARDILLQMQWLLLLEDAPHLSRANLLRRLSVEDFHVFGDDSARKRYLATAASLNNKQSLVQFHTTGSVALVCLYDLPGPAAGGEDKQRLVEKVQEEREFVYRCLDGANSSSDSNPSNQLRDAIQSLKALGQLIAADDIRQVDCQSSLGRPDLQQLFLGQEGEDEEGWVRWRLASFDAVFGRISYGADIVKECVMHSLGVPLAKHFIPQATRTLLERFRVLLQSHRGSNDCEDKDEDERGLYAATAVARAKLESLPSGNAQFALVFAEKDKELMRELFAHYGRTPRMRRIAVAEWNRTFGLLSDSMVAQYTALCGHLAGLVQIGDEVYKLMALLALSGFSSQPSLRIAAQKYVRALRRRLNSNGACDTDAKIRQAMCDVENLALVMNTLATAM